MALGEKVPKELLRDNEETAMVELVFSVDNALLKEKIQSLDVLLEDDLVILSRKISGGRSIARINGEAVSASKLKEVASFLIDIHGQHEHQSLLHKKNHLVILDSYAKEELGDRPEQLKALYQEYKRLCDEMEKSDMDGEERKRELSFLEYEVNEIEEAKLKLGEDEELEKQYEKLSNSQKILSAVGAAYACTSGDNTNASELVGRAVRELQSVVNYDEQLTEIESQLLDLDSLLSDVNRSLGDYLASEELDEQSLYETEKRLDLLNHLKSKYGRTIEEILDNCEKKKERISVLTDYDDYLNQLLTSINKQKGMLKALSEEISLIRKKKSEELCKEIADSLKQLNFLEVKFEMSFEKLEEFTALGTDDAEFMISTNPGELVKPLGKVASGGELSRIMLAIKTVMAGADEIGTLIFDEIDSGISGRTAQMVSQKMNELGRKRQIICITHLPQIASMADRHFLIEKSVEGSSTVSRITPLQEEESVMELARMLGGVEITDTVIQSAREMRQLAMQTK